MRNIFTCIFVFAFFLLTPHFVSAAVRISEIMYDPPGTDTNHEWIEIENNGESPVDISGWKFFENNSNHSLTSIAGGINIAAHGFAIIAENAAVFQTDYPQFGGMLFDSVFSLSNTGETIAMKDSAGNVVNEASYTSSSGANGDGNTLYIGQNGWLSGIATPGASAQSSVQNNTGTGDQTGDGDNTDPGGSGDTNTENTDGQVNNQKTEGGGLATPSGTTAKTMAEKAKAPKKITAKIILPSETILFDANTVFSAQITGTDGNPLLRGTIFWNFGDGESIFAKNLDPVTHVFAYPGRYVVMLQYFENYYDKEPKAIDRATVTVNVASMEFLDDGLTLSLKNKAKTETDMSDWILSDGIGNFIFPKGTILLSGSTIILEKKKSNLQNAEIYNLSYSNGNLVATTALPIASPVVSEDDVPLKEKISIAAPVPEISSVEISSEPANTDESTMEATITTKVPEDIPVMPPTGAEDFEYKANIFPESNSEKNDKNADSQNRAKVILAGIITTITFLSIFLARGNKSKSETGEDLADTDDIEDGGEK